MNIGKRKEEHVEITAGGGAAYDKSTGLERYELIHNALPEINFNEVSTRSVLLGREFDFPLFISSMTGGYGKGGAVNAQIASFCQQENLPFGVGSQRIMLEKPGTRDSFRVVRETAPDAFIAANIGGNQLVGGLSEEDLGVMVEAIRADAVIVHLNPLQELLQSEGDRNFKGVAEGIKSLVRQTDLPIMVKETGGGISADVAKRILNLGVSVIDVAGAGGTSWAKVENQRSSKRNPDQDDQIYTPFENWGIPTAQSILDVDQLRTEYEFELIASGGIRSALDMVKAIALGADFTATAQPVIAALNSGTVGEFQNQYRRWKHQFKIALTLLGCTSPDRLNPGMVRKAESV